LEVVKVKLLATLINLNNALLNRQQSIWWERKI
jgi:hypothetical protein